MTNRFRVFLVFFSLSNVFTTGCGSKSTQEEVHVGAAANLRNVFDDLAQSWKAKSHVTLVPTFGSTAQLAQQIENGAPIDIFLGADTQHIDGLLKKGVADQGSRAVYARGRLVLWAPSRPDITTLRDLAGSGVRKVGIARPELAPYGQAAVESLRHEGIWAAVEPKLVYAQSISASKQFADSGNVDAAFTAYSLTYGFKGHLVLIDDTRHAPIDQALCLTRQGARNPKAWELRAFLLSSDAKAIWTRFGYTVP
jgi:molybdate transport system substrate-binding protein